MLANVLRFFAIVLLATCALGCLPGGKAGPNLCSGCFDETQCRGLACSSEGLTCSVAPHCEYDATCQCVGGHFQCTFTDCATSCATDPDTGTVMLRVSMVDLANGEGLNLDGYNNALPPGGTGVSVAGCGAIDEAGGVDDGLGRFASALAGSVDFGAAFRGMLGDATADAGAGGVSMMTVEIDQIAQSSNDACVSVRVVVQLPGAGPVTVTGAGWMTNHVVLLNLDAPLHLELPLSAHVPASSCAGGVCASASLPITLHGPRLVLKLDASHRTLLPGSVLGGHVFVADSAASYAASNADGWAASLSTFATQTGLDPAFASMIATRIDEARDLHSEPDGSLTPGGCMGADPTSTNRNAVSVALAIGGSAP